jgi:type II secretory pathway pseudopilin PulG
LRELIAISFWLLAYRKMQNQNNNKIDQKKLKANSYKLKASAFTLVETLVAVTVLLLSIAAPLSIAAKALFSAYYSRDQITAYYLAEEAIEYVKNSRDVTFLNDVLNDEVPVVGNQNWLLGLEDCIETGIDFEGCTVDATQVFDPYDAENTAIESCAEGGCPPLNHCASSAGNLDTGLWGQGSVSCNGTPEVSKFTRKVVITPQSNVAACTYLEGGPLADCEEALISVSVTWSGNGLVSGQQTFVLNGAMLNWERK